MYDPKIARFLQEDDSKYSNPNDPLSLNLYTYCHNEPIMYSDPTGHKEGDWWDYRTYVSGAKKVGKAVVNTVSDGASYVADKASDAWDATTSAVSSGYNYVSGNVSNAATWTNDNVFQPAIKTVVNVAKKTPEVALKVLNTVIQKGSDALGNSYEATSGIAPYTRVAMDINKKANPLYWAFDYSTEQGWFSGAFDVGGFYRDDNKIYHAKQSGSLQSWKYAGYNSLYDSVFNGATSMNQAQFKFDYNEKQYTFWAWKGDYLNLGAGAEMGIYERANVNGNQTNHWLVNQDLAMPMTLKMNYRGEPIIDYDPKRDDKLNKEGQGIKKWWVTGFNPKYEDVNATELTPTYTVNFSGNEGMYKAFYDTWNGVEDVYGNTWNFDTKNNAASLTFKGGQLSK
jgi:hypothetical protein